MSLQFKLLIGLLAGLVISAVSVKVTYDYCEGRQAIAEREELKRGIALGNHLRAGANALDEKSTARETEQRAKDKIITKEVIRYVETTPAAQRVVLPGTWRVRHDAAATGQPAADQAGADAAGEPVTDAAAIETVADNYESCRRDKGRLQDFQDRWRLIEASGCAQGNYDGHD
jgi:hypothetical protein